MATQLPPLRIFCGYAHEDKALFEQLKIALAVLIRQEAVSVWHYGDLLPGAQWESEIERELNTANIILLLISPAFMASDYCWSKEMQWAITRNTTGEAHVIPIILKPTDWKTTPLGALQALPKTAKPISTWSDRDEALEDVVNGLRKVIEEAQNEDRYPVKEYVIKIQTYAYEKFQKDIPAQEEAIHQAERWIETISQTGVLQKSFADSQQKKWIAANHQQDCHITIQQNTHRAIDSLLGLFQSVDILLTSQHPALLDQLIEAGQCPYRAIQWTLLDDLNILALGRQIHERMGRPYSNATQIESSYHVEYPLYQPDERLLEGNPIRVTLTSRGPSSPGEPSLPARVSLIHDQPPFRGFYHAHMLLSVQKIISILRGDLPYMQWRQLIDKACTL